MAKKIYFDNKIYTVDETAPPLSSAYEDLKSHLSTEMAGTGANVEFDGQDYEVDSNKLSNAVNTFISYLETIAGSGAKVIVNGVEYSIDASKISDAVTKLHTAFSGLESDVSNGIEVVFVE